MSEKALKNQAVRALELWYGMTPHKKDMWVKEQSISEDGTGYYIIGVRHVTYRLELLASGRIYVTCLS